MVTRLEVVRGSRRRSLNRSAQAAMIAAWIDADGMDEDRFVSDAVGISNAARASAVADQDAFFAAYMTMNGIPTDVRGLSPDDYARPVNPEHRWRRPFTQMRTKLAGGMEFPQAFAFGAAYVRDAIVTDLQFASRTSARDWMQDDNRVVGWSRVLGGGGKSGENCGLCIVASTQRYHVEDLLPIHDNCTCSVVPILGTQDPGQVIRADDMDAVFERLDEMDGRYSSRTDLGRVRIDASSLPRPTVHQHGELGPVLYDASWKFTGPDLIAA